MHRKPFNIFVINSNIIVKLTDFKYNTYKNEFTDSITG